MIDRLECRRCIAVYAASMVGLMSMEAARGEDDLGARTKALTAAHPMVVDAATIGTSRQGRVITALRLTNRGAPADDGPPPPAPEDRPALVVVAGLDGRHLFGADVAMGIAESLAANHAGHLHRVTVYVVVCANPDARAWTLDAGHARMDFGRAQSLLDADRDRRTAEDGAEDLNGDGVVTMMRVRDPLPGSGLRAEYVIDPDNAAIVRRPDAAKGERASVALVPEGTDSDGDGKINEDGVGGTAGGGVNLDQNFPYRWPEFADGAGPFPLSEPESRALVDWLLKVRNVAAVVVMGPGDSVVALPEAGKFEPDGTTPTGIENDDKVQMEEIAKLFKEVTNMAEASPAERSGSLHGWAYAHYGVYSLNTPVWVRPDQIKKAQQKEEAKEEDGKGADGKPDAPKPETPKPEVPKVEAPQPETPRGETGRHHDHGEAGLATIEAPNEEMQPQVPGGGRRRGGGDAPAAAPTGGDKKPSDDGKWLAYDAERVKAGDVSGFIAWKAFEHPQLGSVEIGGFVPGFRLNPPASEVPRLVEEQTRFVVALAARFPRVVVSEQRVERLGPGLWRVWVRVVNEGSMPTLSAMGVKARRHLPTIVRIDAPMERVISGERVNRFWSIAGSGGMADAEWTVRAEDGSEVVVEVSPSIGGKSTVRVRLEEAAR
ncbi:MAG: M14 family zinc carboxypeptidase [Phycisphaerales bacterium]